MTALNERLREIDVAAADPRQCCGTAQTVPALLRAIRVLVEQRDEEVGSYHITLGGTRAEASITISELDTAVLAAMDAKEK